MATPESPQKAVARRLLSIAALEKLLAAEKTKLRAEAAAALPDPGDRASVLLPDGSTLGNVRADAGTAAGWKVTDGGALRAWVETNLPGEIVEQVTTVVNPDYIKSLTAALAAGDQVVVETTGEVFAAVPGIAYVPAGPPKIVTSPDKGAPEALRRLLGVKGAALLGITP